MTVGELIYNLSLFPDHWSVTITDGYKGLVYSGKFEVLPFDDDGEMTVDIGIGGLDLEE